MKASPKLLAALRQAAKDVVDPLKDYYWYSSTRCNCGMLCSALGITPQGQCSWTDFADWVLRGEGEFPYKICRNSGLTTAEIYNSLLAEGLEHADFSHIEMCGFRSDYGGGEYKNPVYVSEFFTKLADKMEAELAVQPAVVEEEEQVQQQVTVRK